MAGRPWTTTTGGVVLEVRVTPKGGRDAIDGCMKLADGRMALKARVRAAASEGAANAALCRLLADALRIAQSRVTVVSGARERRKRVKIEGDAAALAAGLEQIAGTG